MEQPWKNHGKTMKQWKNNHPNVHLIILQAWQVIGSNAATALQRLGVLACGHGARWGFLSSGSGEATGNWIFFREVSEVLGAFR